MRREYTCIKCGRKSFTVKDDYDVCRPCNPKQKQHCKKCKKVYSSTTGREHCRDCCRLLGFLKESAEKQRVSRLLKQVCSDPLVWQQDIKLLTIKLNNNLINPIDVFRVANIYMHIVCNSDKFCYMTPEMQVKNMLFELNEIIAKHIEKPVKKRPGRKKKNIEK